MLIKFSFNRNFIEKSLNTISIKDNKEVKITKENSCPHISEYNKSLIKQIIES